MSDPSDIPEVIKACWIIENTFTERDEPDDSDGITWRVSCDQWWGVEASCSHGKFRGVSNGPLDLQNAFLRVHESFKKGHRYRA